MITLSRPEWANRERETPVSAALMQDIEGISVAYRGKGADAPWQSDWRPGKGAPSLVRIDVALAKGARRWPTLYLVPPSET